MKWLKELIIYLAILLFVIVIRTYVMTPVMVDGDSMNPTLNSGDLLILKKYDHSFDRYDVVVINYNDTKIIKRIIGLPGEHIAYIDNKLYINNALEEGFETPKYTEDFTLEDFDYDVIPEDYYFVLGDNRVNSSDSRVLGLIPKKDIIGTTDIRLYPFNRIGTFR